MENKLDLTLVFSWVAGQFCCGLEPGVIELLPVEEAITQCKDPTTEETAVPIRLGVEVSVSGGLQVLCDCVCLVMMLVHSIWESFSSWLELVPKQAWKGKPVGLFFFSTLFSNPEKPIFSASF